MSAAVTVPQGQSLEVISESSVRFNGQTYLDVTAITYPDGSSKTPAQLLADVGGAVYSANELRRGFKIEGYDPDANDRQVFTVYTNNSKQTTKNETAQVPGGMWAEVFDFKGDATTNSVLKMWADAGLPGFSSEWIGFKLNYGSTGTRAYVATYINDFNEESLPTAPVTLDATFLHDVKLTGIFAATPPQNGHYYAPIRRFRLYRTVVGSDGAVNYRQVGVEPQSAFVGTAATVAHAPGQFPHVIFTLGPWIYDSGNGIPYAFGYQYLDGVRDEDVTPTVLPSADWDPPPFREALQLTEMWNGMLAIHSGNTVMVCEPFRPHTFPSAYRYPLPFEIVGKEVDGNSMVVVTTGPAYLFTGAHPSSLSYEPIQNTQAGRRADLMILGVRTPSRAMCRTPIGVCYASDDGIIVVSGGRSRLLTDALFTKDEWRLRYGPAFGRMRFAYSAGKLLVYFRDTTEVGLLISLDGTSLTEFSATAPFTSTAAMPGAEGVYAVALVNQVTSSVQRFEDPRANRLSCAWLSRKAIMPKAVNFGCMQVVGSGIITITPKAGDRFALSAGSVTLTLTDGVPQLVRLLAGFREREWTVRFDLAPNAILREFTYAGTPAELASA